MLTQQMEMHAASVGLLSVGKSSLSHTHTLRTVWAFQCTKEIVGYKLFLCVPCVWGEVKALMVQFSDGVVTWISGGVGSVLLRVMSSGKIISLCCWCAGVWGHRELLPWCTGYTFTTNLCKADSDHHFDFISPVKAYLQGVMKYTLHVVRGLCTVAADIIKLPWWMAAIYATKYCVCTVWNLSARNTAALAVTSSVWQYVCVPMIDR